METLVSIDSLLGEIAPYIPGAPNLTIRSLATTTAREFFNDSGAWIVELPLVDSVANQNEYTFDPEDGSKILYVLGVGYRKSGNVHHYLSVATQFQLGNTDPASTGTPMVFCGLTNPLGTVRLYPTPDESIVGAIKPFVALTIPDDWDGTLPESIMSAWANVLIDGIVGRAANMQDKPWTNPMVAQYHLRRFRSGIARARDVVRRQYTPAEAPFKFPKWS